MICKLYVIPVHSISCCLSPPLTMFVYIESILLTKARSMSYSEHYAQAGGANGTNHGGPGPHSRPRRGRGGKPLSAS
jgi:hypothetical protein